MLFFKRLKRDVPFVVLLSPALVLMTVFSYLPMFAGIVAFKDFNYLDGFFGSPWAGWDNFKYLFQMDAYYITRNTVLYNVAFIFLGLVVSVALAIMLHELISKRFAKLYQSVLFFPALISWVIVSYIVYAFLSIDKGIVNNALTGWFGVEAVEWYSETVYWPYLIVFISIWKSAGYNAVIYLATIVSIDPEYYESAVLDGASKWKQFQYITLPMLTPVMIILTLLAIGKIFYADTGLFYQVPRNSGVLYPVTNVIDTYILNGLKGQGQIGMTAAAGLYQSFVGLVLVVVTNLIVRRRSKENALF